MFNIAASKTPPTTQATYAHAQLRRLIITGQLKSGDRLRQASLAKDLGVSITPIREALNRLTEEGLVLSEPHKGTSVAALNLDQAEEIYAMRLAIEPLQIARGLPAITSQQIELAEQIHEDLVKTDDIVDFASLNEKFHILTMGLSDSWTSRIVEMLMGASAPYVSFSLRLRPEQIAASHEAHADILEATKARDVQRAIDYEVTHLESTISILRELGDQV